MTEHEEHEEIAFSVLFCSVPTLEKYLYEMLLNMLFLTCT